MRLRQPDLFEGMEPTLKPCKHCGGAGEIITYLEQYSFELTPFKKCRCLECSFETSGMVASCLKYQLKAWGRGTPSLVCQPGGEILLLDDYYRTFWPKTTRPRLRILYGS